MPVFWDSDPSLYSSNGGALGVWDICSLNSVQLPGLALPVVSPKRKTDTRSPKGKHHGSIFNLGHEITEFTLRLHIYDAAQWKEWERIRRNIDPTEINDDDARFFSIAHPSLIDCNVTQVYLNERSNWVSVATESGAVKETIFKGWVIRKPVDSGKKEKAGPTPQLAYPGNVFEQTQPPIEPSKQGIYPTDPERKAF